MARQAVQALLLFGLLCSLAPAPKGQDFDLSDALPDNKKSVTTAPKKPSNDDFSLADAFPDGGNDSISDSEGTSEGATSSALIPGIVGAGALAVVGAISGFIAHQKKKLCFREGGDSTI